MLLTHSNNDVRLLVIVTPMGATNVDTPTLKSKKSIYSSAGETQQTRMIDDEWKIY